LESVKVAATTIGQSLRVSHEIENQIEVIHKHLADFAWWNSCIMDQFLRISNSDMSENRIEGILEKRAPTLIAYPTPKNNQEEVTTTIKLLTARMILRNKVKNNTTLNIRKTRRTRTTNSRISAFLQNFRGMAVFIATGHCVKRPIYGTTLHYSNTRVVIQSGYIINIYKHISNHDSLRSSLLFAAFFIVPGKLILQSIALSLVVVSFNDRKISGSDALNIIPQI
jgi:hypothetical protein